MNNSVIPQLTPKQRVRLDRFYLRALDDDYLGTPIPEDRDPVGVVVELPTDRNYVNVMILGQYHPVTVPTIACKLMNAKSFKAYLDEHELDPEWANAWLKLTYETVDNLHS